MLGQVNTRFPSEVGREVQAIYLSLFPAGEPEFVPRAFGWAEQCFSGRYDDYQAIDARYHDFEHTLQGTLCLARLLRGRHLAQAKPEVPRKSFELCLLAILFHDTGYLKKRDDTAGTGAKYTPVHVNRSADFARDFLSRHGYAANDIAAVQSMIRCTGVNADLAHIPFQSELEKILGFALATADLFGQMAAPDYVEKLPVLFLEFTEAAKLGGERAARFAQYQSAGELMRRTPAFWDNYVLPRINNEFGKLYTFLNDPYPAGPNLYLQRIEANIARLRQQAGEAG